MLKKTYGKDAEIVSLRAALNSLANKHDKIQVFFLHTSNFKSFCKRKKTFPFSLLRCVCVGINKKSSKKKEELADQKTEELEALIAARNCDVRSAVFLFNVFVGGEGKNPHAPKTTKKKSFLSFVFF